MNFELDKPNLVTYKAADKIEYSRYTDMLVLNSLEGKHQWKQGELISKNKVLISVR